MSAQRFVPGRQCNIATVTGSEARLTRVLVVENERLVARDLSEALRELGYAVIGVAATGAAAIAQARTDRPDVVLMDIRLDGAIDGIETAAQIQVERRVPVIYLTAQDRKSTRLNSSHSSIS